MMIPMIQEIIIDFFSVLEYFSTRAVKPEVAFAFRMMAIKLPKMPTVSTIHVFSSMVVKVKSRYCPKNPVPYPMTHPTRPPKTRASKVFFVIRATTMINRGGNKVIMP